MNNSLHKQPQDIPGGYWANTGGPMSRTRKERIVSSILGDSGGFIKCPLLIRVGLRFQGQRSPVGTMEQLLRDEGYATPDALREVFELPSHSLLARPVQSASWRLEVPAADRLEILRQALILGLCSSQMYDPGRPVLWTENSLARALELYDPVGFYA
jgi:hypothetical protein